jgi:hypothetical protein
VKTLSEWVGLVVTLLTTCVLIVALQRQVRVGPTGAIMVGAVIGYLARTVVEKWRKYERI